jgi:hypothetical protein
VTCSGGCPKASPPRGSSAVGLPRPRSRMDGTWRRLPGSIRRHRPSRM